PLPPPLKTFLGLRLTASITVPCVGTVHLPDFFSTYVWATLAVALCVFLYTYTCFSRSPLCFPLKKDCVPFPHSHSAPTLVFKLPHFRGGLGRGSIPPPPSPCSQFLCCFSRCI